MHLSKYWSIFKFISEFVVCKIIVDLILTWPIGALSSLAQVWDDKMTPDRKKVAKKASDSMAGKTSPRLFLLAPLHRNFPPPFLVTGLVRIEAAVHETITHEVRRGAKRNPNKNQIIA